MYVNSPTYNLPFLLIASINCYLFYQLSIVILHNDYCDLHMIIVIPDYQLQHKLHDINYHKAK